MGSISRSAAVCTLPQGLGASSVSESSPWSAKSPSDLDAEPELLVGHLQAPRVVLQLPGLLQVFLHPPDVIHRGLEDGALVPAHIPAATTRWGERGNPEAWPGPLTLGLVQRAAPTLAHTQPRTNVHRNIQVLTNPWAQAICPPRAHLPVFSSPGHQSSPPLQFTALQTLSSKAPPPGSPLLTLKPPFLTEAVSTQQEQRPFLLKHATSTTALSN